MKINDIRIEIIQSGKVAEFIAALKSIEEKILTVWKN
jgi:hypothetical protein